MNNDNTCMIDSLYSGASSEDTCGESGVQLQRIMSRCSCQVYYASYGGNVDPNIAAQIVHSDANKVS